jgi:signal transduction histidine kinase
VSELNQVWTNLIDNAIDAMESKDNPVLEIETRKDREFIQTFVRDNGAGIPEEVMSRIFDPFYTTKEIGKGTGLGLDVVKTIINKHRGTIKVRSEAGKTEFEVCIPIE